MLQNWRIRVVIKAIIVGLTLTSASPVASQDFEAGFKAWEEGDYETAASEFRVLADQGDAMSQFFMGRFYASGAGVPHDEAEAAKWYQMAAEQEESQALDKRQTAGISLAQHSLGVAYANGVGVPQDYTEARKMVP